ncbi:MAG: PKD domain-containing protein [Solirubrobacterales bacterium]
MGGIRTIRILAAVAASVALTSTFGVGAARALILPPTVIDGPSLEGLKLGGVAMAPDGTGGLVYTKTVSEVPHVFASRYDGSSWSPPIRVDSEGRYEATEPQIAASDGGRLMVVWVTPVATLAGGELRRGLYSASLGSGASEFGSALLVDPNLKAGVGVEPSLAGTGPGKAIVAYRVITHTFGIGIEFTNAVQLRPGDVVADIRVARLEGDRWARLGAINRNPAASMRPPSEINGPRVAIGSSGRAVVAWQEPDVTGAARILMRRVTGTTLGPVVSASPESFEGKPVSEDATAFGLAVTENDRARLAVRADGAASSTLHGQRVFLTSLGSNTTAAGAKALGPEVADGGSPVPPVGPPAVAAAEGTGTEGALAIAYASGSSVQLLGVDSQGHLQPPHAVPGPTAQPATPVVAGVDPEGGGVEAWEAYDETGAPSIAVHQEYPNGESQSGTLYGPIGGGVSQLLGATSERGDALVAFRQGESGEFAIVADRIASPPASFAIEAPKKWVAPPRALLRWPLPESSAGGLTYGLVVDGRVVKSHIYRRRVLPAPGMIGNGIKRVQVIATDRFGGDVISKPAKLRVDGQPPSLKVKVRRSSGTVFVRLQDAQSGLRTGATHVSFGDGTRTRGKAKIRHHYAAAGRYEINVRARDRVGNRLAQKLSVVVR